MTEPFGAFTPSPFEQRVRALGRRLPRNEFGRKAASLLLGPAGGRKREPRDVFVFDSQKARLHPYDNICEKRVYLTPQFWEAEERDALAAVIREFRGRIFRFADIGANVGLYSLFARSQCALSGAEFRGLAVDADEEMTARLRFNALASGAGDELVIETCAVSDSEGTAQFFVNRESRGESRLSEGGERIVPTRLLKSLVDASGLGHADVMKLDIEGHEARALGAYFASTPNELTPRAVIIETSHRADAALELLRVCGYILSLATRRNAVLIRADHFPG